MGEIKVKELASIFPERQRFRFYAARSTPKRIYECVKAGVFDGRYNGDAAWLGEMEVESVEFIIDDSVFLLARVLEAKEDSTLVLTHQHGAEKESGRDGNDI